VDGVVVGGQKVEELDGHRLLLGQLAGADAEQAGDVLVGDRVVLARLHARLALTELRAADADQLEDATAEQAAASPRRALLVDREELAGLVGEDLQRHRGGVQPLGDAVLDDPPWLLGQLVGGDGFDHGHGAVLPLRRDKRPPGQSVGAADVRGSGAVRQTWSRRTRLPPVRPRMRSWRAPPTRRTWRCALPMRATHSSSPRSSVLRRKSSRAMSMLPTGESRAWAVVASASSSSRSAQGGRPGAGSSMGWPIRPVAMRPPTGSDRGSDWGRARTKPWARDTPAACRAASSLVVSAPSAMTTAPISPAKITSAVARARRAGSSLMCWVMDMSILMMSGRRRSTCRNVA